MFGRSKKKQAAQQMQVAPEALALLQAMQAGQQMAQQQQMQQQMMMQQQMGQPPMGQQPMGQQPAMMPQQPMMQPPQTEMAPQASMPDPQMMAQPGMAAAQPQMSPMQAPVAEQAAPQMAPTAPAMMAPNAFAQTPFAQDMSPQTEPAMMDEAGAPAMGVTGIGAPLAPAAQTKAQKKEAKRQAQQQAKADKEAKKAAKLAATKEKAEEKKRAKLRKKLAKTRFSRARYLREANGNAIAGVVLWVFIILIFTVGPFMLNTTYLIPTTNENLRIINEVDNLKRSVRQNQPQISAMLEKRKQKEAQIASFTTSFTPQAQAQAQLESLVTQLEDAGMELTEQAITPLGLPAQRIVGTTLTISAEGDYLDWLRIRNKFIRSQRAVSMPSESIIINEETGNVIIAAQIVLPSAP